MGVNDGIANRWSSLSTTSHQMIQINLLGQQLDMRVSILSTCLKGLRRVSTRQERAVAFRV